MAPNPYLVLRLRKLDDFEFTSDMEICGIERTYRNADLGNWKEKSIFFELPYREILLFCHNLNVIHIERNVCDKLIGTVIKTLMEKPKTPLELEF